MSSFKKIFKEAEAVCLKQQADEQAIFLEHATSLNRAIELACASDFCGAVHSHQRRVGRGALKNASTHLLSSLNAIRQVTNFEELHSLVETQIGHIDRIGELAVYDISERIGWFLRIEPDAIYLHAGTRVGAVKLLNRKLGSRIYHHDLPNSFSRFTASQIETLLCVYKEDWSNPSGFTRSNSCSPKAMRLRRC